MFLSTCAERTALVSQGEEALDFGCFIGATTSSSSFIVFEKLIHTESISGRKKWFPNLFVPSNAETNSNSHAYNPSFLKVLQLVIDP